MSPPRWQLLVKEIRLLLQGSVRLFANFKKMGKAKFTQENAEDRLMKLTETWARCEALNLELELLLPDAERSACPFVARSRSSSVPRTNTGLLGTSSGKLSSPFNHRLRQDRRRGPTRDPAVALRAFHPLRCPNSPLSTRSGRVFATCSRRSSSGTRLSVIRRGCSTCTRRWRVRRPRRSPISQLRRPISAPRELSWPKNMRTRERSSRHTCVTSSPCRRWPVRRPRS